MLLHNLVKQKLITPPQWLPDNTNYLVIMGSVAYGVSSDTSDMDIYGWAIPPKETVFPHLAGEIEGFIQKVPRFEQFQQHHVKDVGAEKEYDFAIFNIVKYFKLCMGGNPNMIDSMFVPQNCVLHSTNVANLVRDNRHLFLSKLMWPTFKGYSYSQLHKMRGKNPEAGSKRAELREKFSYDVKFAYHVVRLLSEIEQVLLYGDLDLQEKGRREHMKAIRNGEVKEQDIYDWAASKEKELETLYANSNLPVKPDDKKIEALLLQCLESHYGSLKDCVVQPDLAAQCLREINYVLSKYN